jgi:hypothetical protein
LSEIIWTLSPSPSPKLGEGSRASGGVRAKRAVYFSKKVF